MSLWWIWVLWLSWGYWSFEDVFVSFSTFTAHDGIKPPLGHGKHAKEQWGRILSMVLPSGLSFLPQSQAILDVILNKIIAASCEPSAFLSTDPMEKCLLPPVFVSRDQRNGFICLHITFSRRCPHRLEWQKLPFSSVLLIFHSKTQILEFKGKHSSKWWILRMKGTLCLAYGPQKQVCVSQLKAKQWFIWSRVFLLSPEVLDTSRVTRKQVVIKGWKDSPWINYFSILCFTHPQQTFPSLPPSSLCTSVCLVIHIS